MVCKHFLFRAAAPVAALALLSVTASACQNCKKDYVFGAPSALGNGMAWAWVRLDAKKKPVAFGISMTESALDGLPVDMPGAMPMLEVPLEMPKVKNLAPYDHVVLNWNPKGHIPAGIYDKPHFDFHFFTISEKTRKAITAKGADLKRCMKQPAAKYIPEGYILPPGTAEPQMGSHWVHPASKELNGEPFSGTFIWGTYDGKPAFYEPMITLAMLDARGKMEQKVALPKAVPVSGLYPTKYRVEFNADRREFSVSLEGLTWRKAG